MKCTPIKTLIRLTDVLLQNGLNYVHLVQVYRLHQGIK
nr:MAG TPA: hypothetical protein [Caudoviricetes sp.]